MYLRLPMVVGEGGLYLAIGIILAAHLISVTTGLSVSSIATDKRVEAGGAYYIVSRSMGLAIGGTLGIALFVGLSFSISLYIIGFSESFLSAMGLPRDLATIRLCGTITLVLLTGITFVSTSLAIRAQYIILALIGASLLSVFLGGPEIPPASPHLLPPSDGQAATVLFGIFFPAVTGFTAGVNMSGDLRDPRRAIPLGTVASIAVGMVVYVTLAVFIAYTIPAQMLVEDYDTVFADLAWSKEAVIAGIWGATLSSALGSILGAPRILQALSLDQITPRIFGIGQGPSNEPRYALVLAFIIGEIGILIGQLDQIAGIVSVFFIATYGFLNLSASFEMIASPDFRPDFRIPVWVPVVGAVTCVVLMIWLDLVSMLGAVVVMSALFFVIKRRELQLETGDTLLGVWSSVVRMGLHRLTLESQHQRNWLPNILLFTDLHADSRRTILDFGRSLIRNRGIATEFLLADGPPPEGDETGDLVALEQGFFHRNVSVDGNLYDTMTAVCRFHGFSGLQPNTVMLDWHAHAERPDPFAQFLDQLADLDFNVMGIAYDPARGFGKRERIDLWWSADAGSLALNIALVRFISASDEWRRAKLRFFVVTDDPSMTDTLHKTTTLALENARIEGLVKVVNNAVEARGDEELVAQYSAPADLTVLGLPHLGLDGERVTSLERLVRRIGCVLVVRASSQFASGFAFRGASLKSHEDAPVASPAAIPGLELPNSPDLVGPAQLFADAHDRVLASFGDRSVSGLLTAQVALVGRIREAVDAQFREFEDAASGPDTRWRTRIYRRGPERLHRALGELLSVYVSAEVPRRLASAERGVDELLDGLGDIAQRVPRRLEVVRDASDFGPQEGDPHWLTRYKARQRLWARLFGRSLRTRVRPAPLVNYYLAVETLELARVSIVETASRSLDFADDLARFFHVLKDGLHAVQARALEGSLDEAFVAAESARVREHLEGLNQAYTEVRQRQLDRLAQAARRQQQAFADDLARPHLDRFVSRERRMPRDTRGLSGELADMPDRWSAQQELVLARPALANRVAVVQTRLSSEVRNACKSLERGIEDGVRSGCADLRRALERFRNAWSVGEGKADLDVDSVDASFDSTHIVDDLHEALKTATADVPETIQVMREASLQALASDPFHEVEVATVGLRRHLQFLIDGELVGPIQEILAEVPRAEQRARSVGQDITRLITFTVTDSEGADLEQVQQSLEPVIVSGFDRIDAELERLATLSTSLQNRILEQLDHVLDLMSSLAIVGTAEAFEAHGRRLAAADLSGLGRISERVATEVRNALVTLAYRRSAGVLLARRVALEEDANESAADGVLALVDDCIPSPEVIEKLPFYYVQLYSGQSALHSAFWVGREPELSRIRRGVHNYERGFHGAVVVTGDPGSGKTALCEVAIERFLPGRPVYRITPPPGGSCDPDVFRATLESQLNGRGSVEDLFEGLPEGSVVLLHNAEMWWERSVRGLVVLDQITELIERFGDRSLFFVEMGRSAYRFLARYSTFGAGALVRAECGPVDAEVLKEMVTVRHNSTGMRFALDGKLEGEVSGWALAQLFTAYFDHSDGNVGAALHAWLAHIQQVDGDTLTLVAPRAPVDDALDALEMAWVAVLVQVVLHKELTMERLLRVSGLSRVRLTREIAALRRTGLLADVRRDIIELEPRAQHLVMRSLHRRGLLP